MSPEPQPIDPEHCRTIGHFEPDTAAWRNLRHQGIGGSDASIILGINPYKNVTELFAEKVKRFSPPLDNPAVNFGKMAEPILLDHLNVSSGAALGTLCSSEHEFMIANIDGYIQRDGQIIGVEIKTCSARTQRYWEAGVPDLYLAQIQHYMAVTGWESFEVHCMVAPYDRRILLEKRARLDDTSTFDRKLIKDSPLMSFVVPRNENMIKRLVDAEGRFWNRVVSTREQSEPPHVHKAHG